VLHANIAVTEPTEALARLGGQRLDPLGAVDALHQARQHRRLVARAGAHLEHLVAVPDLEQIRHQRNDVGLRDRLPVPDRKRAVLVGAGA
jgi:hypothetical protein